MSRAVAGGGIAVVALAGALFANAGTGGAQTCARPNLQATVIRAVEPDTPPIAQQQGIRGTVDVLVSLDANSRVTGTSIRSSPSAILNAAALKAAREAMYQTEIRDCAPIASYYVLSVQFDTDGGNAVAAPAPRTAVQARATPSSADGRPIVTVSAQGIATRPPDIAYVTAGVVTNDDVAANATAKNDAIYDAVRANLIAVGIGETAIRDAYFGITFVARPTPAPHARTPVTATPPPGGYSSAIASPPPYNYPNGSPRYGYVATRLISVTDTDVPKIGAVMDALLSARVTALNVQYVLLDRRAAYEQALAAALKDAASQAQAVATASRMHVAGIKQIQVGQNLLGPPTPAPGPPNPYVPAYTRPSTVVNVHPVPVEVRAGVTVTYFLKL